MSARNQTLAARRLELLERSGVQRASVLGAAGPLLRQAATLDRMVGHVRRHPVAAVLAVAAVALFGPRRLFDWGTRALTLYMLFRR